MAAIIETNQNNTNDTTEEYITIYKPLLIYDSGVSNNVNEAEALRFWNNIKRDFLPSLHNFIMFLATTKLAEPTDMKESDYNFFIEFIQKQIENGNSKIDYPSKVPENFDDTLNQIIQDIEAFKVEYKEAMIDRQLWNYYGFHEISVLMFRHNLNTMTELKNKFSCDELMQIIEKKEQTQIRIPKIDDYDF